MLNVPVYNEAGENIGSEQIDPTLLGGEVNAALLKQAIVMWQANQRQGHAVQKSRGQVVGSTKKLYRQKGTGRARAGNLRTPVRVGGGAAFANTVREHRKDMPKKMRRFARNNALLAKIEGEGVLIVDSVKFEEPKTKRFAAMLKAVGCERGCTFATDGVDKVLHMSGRNIEKTDVVNVSDINAYAILQRSKLVFTKAAFERFRDGLVSVGKAEGDQSDVKMSDVSEG